MRKIQHHDLATEMFAFFNSRKFIPSFYKLNRKLKNKAIFLDRDGTINQDFSFVYKIEDLKLLDRAKEGLTELRNLGYKLIIITNQSGIGRGYYTIEDCNKFNEELENQLGLKFDGIYICPHSPDENCECRKPKTLLVENAIKDFDLDVSLCFFVGDKESDIETGINVGCKTVVINGSNYKCNIEPDFCVNDLLEFAEMIK